MSTLNMTDFLLARIAEDDKEAHVAWPRPTMTPERLRADCEAKRRTVELLGDVIARFETDTGPGGPWVVQQILAEMAKPYADHPDHDPAWTV